MSIHDIRKRFVKDNKLQIPIVQSPYFEYFLKSYSYNSTKYYGINRKYKKFEEAVKEIGEEKFLAKTFFIADEVSNYIKQKESYEQFNTGKMDNYAILNLNLPSKDIFSPHNHGKSFISIDLKQANFHALKYVNSDIVDNKETYEDFIGQFTDIENIINSKYVRQVIFGKLNPKRISSVEKYVTHQILQAVLEIVPIEHIKFFSHDEIVIEIDPEFDQNGYPLFEIEDRVVEKGQKLGMPVRVEAFELIAQNPHKKLGFVKNGTDGTIEFKGVTDIFFAQAYKKYFNIPLQENDLKFFHEGQLATFLSPIEED